jgi:hypothetical protein
MTSWSDGIRSPFYDVMVEHSSAICNFDRNTSTLPYSGMLTRMRGKRDHV